MFRISNTPYTPDVTPRNTAEPASVADAASPSTQVSDQVELSHSSTAPPQDRSDRIAALKSIATSPDYLPPSLPVSQKIIAGALSRAG